MSNDQLQQRLGQLAKIRPGTMNPVLINTKPSITIATGDSTVSIAQKINSMVSLDTYGTLVGVVTAFEQHNIGEVDTQLFKGAQKSGVRGVAYVYIDVLHSTHSHLLTSSNFKNFLTAVEVLQEGVLIPGARIVVGFKSSDYSRGSFIKLIDASGFSEALVQKVEIPRSLKPCIELKQPVLRSTPSNYTDRNPGYYQALYELAKWQIKYYDIKITGITFPFNADDDTRVSGKINAVLQKVVAMNDKFLKDLQENSNPQKQWATLVAQFTQDATYESSNDSRMIITVDASEDITPAVTALNNYSRSYKAEKRDKTSFFLSFPKSDIKLGTGAALSLTAKNLTAFKNSFEKIMYDETTAPPLHRSRPTVQSTTCDTSAKSPRTETPNGEWQANLQLTENFKVRDIDKDAVAPMGNPKQTGEQVQSNIINVAKQLEIIREALDGARITITGRGGYQPPLKARGNWWKKYPGFYAELPENKGKKDPGRKQSSQHRLGKAVDIQVKGLTSSMVWKVVKDLMASGKIINGGLGWYPGFVHYDIRSKEKRWFTGGYPDQYSSYGEASRAATRLGA